MRILVILIILIFSIYGYSQKSEIEPYVDYLKKVEKKSAKDYILEKFENYDIVILCERDHSEISQYELIKEVISDEYFKKNVKNIFSEIGVINLQPEITDFLKIKSLDSLFVEEKLREFQRNASFWSVWDRYSYNYFLRTIYNINNHSENQISLYPSDSEFDWKKVKTAEDYKKKFEVEIEPRDSLIAFNIINKYEEIKSPTNKKALVILNYRHAFKVHSFFSNGEVIQNAGKYLADYFGNHTTFIMSNMPIFHRKDNDWTYELIQDGKWDAAFKILEIDDIGFDFKDAKFGSDSFDLQNITNVHSYNDVFDGFVFYRKIENHTLIDYLDELVSKDFEKEFLRRYRIFFKYMENERILKMLENEESVKKIINELNTKRYRKYKNFDFLIQSRDKYLID